MAFQPFDWSGKGSWDDRCPPIEPAPDIPIPPPRPGRGRTGKGTDRTYVLGIEGAQPVKIGYTGGEPSERLRALQTGLPFELTLLWSTPGDFESQLHDMFAEYRVRGEWFDLTSLGDPVQVVRSTVRQIRLHAVIR
jgi:hypothetical protein